MEHFDNVDAQLRGEVLREAHELFDYKADAFGAAGPLAAALRKLEIRPLRPEQVAAYMASKEYTKTYNKRERAARIGLSSIWAVALGLCAVWAPYALAHKGWDPVAPFLVSLLVVGVLGTVGWFAFLDISGYVPNEDVVIVQKWMTKPLCPGGYSRYVPVHVLNLAVQVKKKVPACELYVHELTRVEQRRAVPALDPFLQVVLGAENYYIAVWDEREFEARA